MFSLQPFRITPNVDNLVKEFLDASPFAKLKVSRIFSHIKEFGLTSNIPHIKKLTGTLLWEIRILGQDNLKILYITRAEKEILHLNAFEKKTDKTPPKKIKIAINIFSKTSS